MQLVTADNDRLPLVASLGFTPDMKRELDQLDREHRFSREIIGYGHSIIIPSLNRDGRYNIAVFKESGFRSLLAVPIMTYRIHGILGMAYRNRTKFDDDIVKLCNVIANLVGMSLHKSNLNKQLLQKKLPETAAESEVKPEDTTVVENAAMEKSVKFQDDPRPPVKEKPRDEGFLNHARSMKDFYRSHH